ncbi:carbonic anhydrase [Thermomonospora cellulosilytica]|uniref:carbonic anhydrase n=1 Tax=Thermomonospora cellulosilytica TaxID=1411118 RepID=A0A7W3MZN1_9ACTN|nr:carbonic anhydrase [Thermomonospora cellulosilytica]MBA9004819.1 carbonic anhydrase [Thermomonospora cellulosilytica]
MHTFIEHARSFPARVAAAGESLAPLADGQQPEALFVTCSDSRVVPSLITGARPGQLFELRTAGQIVPRYSLDRPTGEAATIEFAVEVLGVTDIVVCGHSQCAAVAALARGDDLTAVPAMSGWLAQAAEPVRSERPSERDLDHAVREHVLAQLERLRGYPVIRRRLDDGRITLHGWFYQVHTGLVFAHRPGDDLFLPL